MYARVCLQIVGDVLAGHSVASRYRCLWAMQEYARLTVWAPARGQGVRLQPKQAEKTAVTARRAARQAWRPTDRAPRRYEWVCVSVSVDVTVLKSGYGDGNVRPGKVSMECRTN